mgnify:CR=1 FL=1
MLIGVILMPQPKPRRSSPRSVVRVLQVLEKLSDESQEWSLSLLSRELGTPKSSLLVLLRGLVDTSHIRQSAGTYRLAGAAYALASHILSSRHFPEVARPILDDVVSKTGETAVIGVLSEDAQSTVYVDKVESPSALRFSSFPTASSSRSCIRSRRITTIPAGAPMHRAACCVSPPVVAVCC